MNEYRKLIWDIKEVADKNDNGIGNILKVQKVMSLDAHEIHVFLSHRIEKRKLVSSIRKKQTQK